MDINDKKVTLLTKLMNWAVGLALATFLIILSANVLSDLGTMDSEPMWTEQEYLGQDYLEKVDNINAELERSESQARMLQGEIDFVSNMYETQKESFNNWLETRKVTGLSENDPVVIERTRSNDMLLDSLNQLQSQISQARKQHADLRDQQLLLTDPNNDLWKAATARFNRVSNVYELKIFGIRLLLTLPVMLLGIFFFIRFRHHKYRALFLGFTLYSVYVFFFGLVPYLPSFGGYVRSIVGVILTVVLGVYAIKYWSRYAKKKTEKLMQDAQERKQQMQSNVAMKAYTAHVCPSCGKDYMVPIWEANKQEANQLSHFCLHCGMVLFADCNHCHKLIYAHAPYCRWCGMKTQNDKK